MAYGLSDGHVTDEVTWSQRWCEAVQSAILARAWLLVYICLLSCIAITRLDYGGWLERCAPGMARYLQSGLHLSGSYLVRHQLERRHGINWLLQIAVVSC